MPYGTYRRHLALATERLIGQLLRQTAPQLQRTDPESDNLHVLAGTAPVQ
ncbi:hypothetical protein [Streptomyces sp. NPDC094472]